jgi:hypothetical protein
MRQRKPMDSYPMEIAGGAMKDSTINLLLAMLLALIVVVLMGM